jgi:ketosteroid isomerase-like protein
MSHDNRERIQSAYDAFGRGDIGAVLATFDENIEWNAPAVLPHAMTVKGRDAVAGFFQNLVATWDPGFGIEIDALIVDGDRACAIGRASGQIDGVDMSYGLVHSWELRDGLCVRFSEYVDPSAELILAATAVRG